MVPAKGSRVRVEEWEHLFDRTAGRAALQSHGLRFRQSKGEDVLRADRFMPAEREGAGWRGAFCV